MKNLGERTKLYRTKKGLTQAELGKHVGLSQASVSSIERGHDAKDSSVATLKIVLNLDDIGETLIHGFDSPRKAPKKTIWQRFKSWIVK